MAKTKKHSKKHPLSGFLQSRGITLAAIIMLCVSLGVIMIPGIFAAQSSPSVTGLTAIPGNGSGYSIRIVWDGYTNDHWRGQRLQGSTVRENWTSNAKQTSFSGLTCGEQYTFTVAAAGPGGGAQSAYRSVSAATACPQAIWDSLTTNGNNVTLRWHNGGFAQSYTTYVSSGGGFAATTTTSTSRTFTGACNTTYIAYLKASANGQTGSSSPTRSVKTDPCPVVVIPQNPGGGSSGGSSGGTGGTGSTGTSGNTAPGTKKPAAKTTPTTPAAPATQAAPQNFAADIVSHKIVKLSWDAAAGADHYVLSRSTDNATWQELTSTKSTTYEDESANFSTTYYYQLQAVAAAGKLSSTVTTQATTDAFKSSSSTITSQDKLVTVKIPDGAIVDDEYSCAVSTDEGGTINVPDDQSTLLGPYDVLCVGVDGVVIDDFQSPLAVTMKLASVAEGYKDITVRVRGDNAWQTVKSTYDQSKQQISFTLTSNKAFAAFGVKQKSPVGLIVTIFLLLLLAAGAVIGFLWWRRRAPAMQAAAQAEITAEQEFKQALAQPDCTHLQMAQQVIPSSQGCYECEQNHTQWTALRICLVCGHVGCSDDSSEQHAFKHFHETGHPIMYEYGNPNGNTIGWCYIDQTYI